MFRSSTPNYHNDRDFNCPLTQTVGRFVAAMSLSVKPVSRVTGADDASKVVRALLLTGRLSTHVHTWGHGDTRYLSVGVQLLNQSSCGPAGTARRLPTTTSAVTVIFQLLSLFVDKVSTELT